MLHPPVAPPPHSTSHAPAPAGRRHSRGSRAGPCASKGHYGKYRFCWEGCHFILQLLKTIGFFGCWTCVYVAKNEVTSLLSSSKPPAVACVLPLLVFSLPTARATKARAGGSARKVRGGRAWGKQSPGPVMPLTSTTYLCPFTANLNPSKNKTTQTY